jgi:hypothetical protein
MTAITDICVFVYKILCQTSPQKNGRATQKERTHGREIRCASFYRLDDEMVLLATGAENASLRISSGRSTFFLCLQRGFFFSDGGNNLVDSHGHVTTLFSDAALTAALKQVVWASSKDGTLLFVCGARELLRVFRVRWDDEEGIDVLPVGVAEAATSDAETRIMDCDVIQLDAAEGLFLVVCGYSDGALRVCSPVGPYASICDFVC